MKQDKLDMIKQELASLNTESEETVNQRGLEWENLIEMTILYYCG